MSLKRTRLPHYILAGMALMTGTSMMAEYNHVNGIMGSMPLSDQFNQAAPKATVVFAGSHARICHAIQMLKTDAQRQIYISGDPNLYTKGGIEITCDVSLAADEFSRVTTDVAVNTYDNALRSAQWLQAHHYTNVELVTNDYHMARSVLELARVYDGHITPTPVNENTSRKVIETENLKFWVRLAGIPVSRNYQFTNI